MNELIPPHGGILKNLIVDGNKASEVKELMLSLSSITLTNRQLCDIELLINGAFSPLKGFMDKADYDSVLYKNRLQNNIIWTIPITLDISYRLAETLSIGDSIVLRDQEGIGIAVLEISDIWEPDLKFEADTVYGSNDILHPSVNFLFAAK